MVFDWMTRDGKLLLTTRSVRSFGYGFLSVILAIYLHLIGFSDVLIGAVLSATLLGSAVFTIFASTYADRIGRRRMLLLLALLMAISGIMFALTENRIALFVAAIIGTLSPTGSEIGSFLPMEQAILPQTTSEERRNSAFAAYNTVGTLSSAAGTLFSGLAAVLQNSFNFGQLESFHVLFLVYSALALTAAALYLAVSSKVELQKEHPERPRKRLSPESRTIIAKLSALFGLDAFAGGFVLQTIISFWFFTRYGVSEGTLSVIFFIAGILTTISFYAAIRIARRIGLIRTMVFTHIPSNVLLMLVPVANTFILSLAFYLARQAISQMDVPTRQSYTMAVVSPEERIPAAGITSISRNLAQATSPSLSGYAMQAISLSSPFFIGGSLKIIYDVGVYFNFRKVKPPEEE
jgi:predicted MFS family arabinose efflux permease